MEDDPEADYNERLVVGTWCFPESGKQWAVL